MVQGSEKSKKIHSAAKDRNKALLLAYLSDFENDWPRRQDYSSLILGYKNPTQIYRTLSPEEISQIESEAVEIIKVQSSRQRKELYKSLHKEGKNGNVAAIREFLDRTEGKVADKLDGNINVKQRIIIRRRTRDGEDG